MKTSFATIFLIISLVLCCTLFDITNADDFPTPEAPQAFPTPEAPQAFPTPEAPQAFPTPEAPQASGEGLFCNNKCGVRCAQKGIHSRCMKYCMMCCDKCRCVPSGTYGHQDECPCYRDWKSPNGRPKCP